jgi:CHAD domain-containing protein
MDTRLREDVGVKLDPGTRADLAVREILLALANEIDDNRQAVVGDEGVRPLHRFRIAVRRTRTLLGQFKATFDIEDVLHFRSGFRRLASLTGPVRDLDVLSSRISDTCDRLPKEARSGVDRVSEVVVDERRIYLAPLVDWLRSDEYEDFRADWRRCLADTVPSPERAAEYMEPVATLAARTVWKAYQRVVRHAGPVVLGIRKGSEADIHRLRISCKKLRYTMEAFESLFEPVLLEKLLLKLRKVQDAIGDYRDCGLHASILEDYRRDLKADGQLDRAIKRAVGSLIRLWRKEARRCRAEFEVRIWEILSDEYRRDLARVIAAPTLAVRLSMRGRSVNERIRQGSAAYR